MDNCQVVYVGKEGHAIDSRGVLKEIIIGPIEVDREESETKKQHEQYMAEFNELCLNDSCLCDADLELTLQRSALPFRMNGPGEAYVCEDWDDDQLSNMFPGVTFLRNDSNCRATSETET